jgi:hypothetical protein
MQGPDTIAKKEMGPRMPWLPFVMQCAEDQPPVVGEPLAITLPREFVTKELCPACTKKGVAVLPRRGGYYQATLMAPRDDDKVVSPVVLLHHHGRLDHACGHTITADIRRGGGR